MDNHTEEYTSSNTFWVGSDTFEPLIQEHNIVFLDFFAHWCVPCKQFENVYEQVAAQYADIFFGKVNVEVEKELSEAFNIRSIPHLMVFKSGFAIYSESGCIPLSTLKDLVQQARTVKLPVFKSNL